MSQVIGLTEKEKEEVIKYLAGALSNTLIYSIPSNNVLVILLPFMSSCLLKNLKEEGGEKVEKEKRTIQPRKESKEN